MLFRTEQNRLDQRFDVAKGVFSCRPVSSLVSRPSLPADKNTLWNRSMEKMGMNKFAETGAGKVIFGNSVVRTVMYGANYNIHDAIAEDDHVAAMWEGAEVFDFKTERLFRYLQVRRTRTCAESSFTYEIGFLASLIQKESVPARSNMLDLVQMTTEVA